MCRMRTLFITCLLAVSVGADESVCDCSSESAKAAKLSSQVKKLEGQLEESKSGSKQVGQQLDALKASSKKELEASRKAEADLQKKVKELEGSHASAGKDSEKKLNDLKDSSKKTETELRAQIEELSKKLEQAETSGKDVAAALQECGENQRISMMDFASKVGSMTNGVVKHALDKTDLDEKFATSVGAHVGTAKGAAGKMASNIKGHITSVNYTKVMERVSSSGAYQSMSEKFVEKTQTLRPHFNKARTHLEPALAKAQDMAGPAWTKAQPTLEKVKTKAAEAYVVGAAAVKTHVLPVLKRGGSSALDQAAAVGLAQLEKAMTPVFDMIAKAAPEQAETLPTHPVDRLLFLIVTVLCGYYSLYFVRTFLRIVLRLTTKTSWMSLKLFRLIVMIPLRILLYLIDFAWWVVTLFYCCGMCRKRKKVDKLSAKAKKEEKKNGEAASKAGTVTAAECQSLFEMSKKKNKVEEGAQQLAKFVRDQKPMKATSVQGKILTKDVFLQTCKKFNVNIKNLEL